MKDTMTAYVADRHPALAPFDFFRSAPAATGWTCEFCTPDGCGFQCDAPVAVLLTERVA